VFNCKKGILMQRQAVFFGTRSQITEAEFDRLFLDSYQKIAAAAYRLVGDPDEADDLAAEAFWKLWQNPPRSQENLLGWLYRTVINLGYNRLRSSRRRSGYEENAYRLDVDQSSLNPLEEAERRQEAAQVRAVLKNLPERDVQILILHSSGLTYKDIAAALNVNPASLGTLLARAEHKFESQYARGENHALRR
jgi:RNA polymerase sigma-70 factor, ECF subfamily